MKHIRSIRKYEPTETNGKTIVYMHGYGGFTWEAWRQLRVLTRAGYRVIALDFTYLLRPHNPQELLDLMDEVDELFQHEKLITQDLLIVGISLGGLVGYNMLRRHKELKKLLIITGGNIALLPSDKSLAKHWKLTREQLIEKWMDVNMYTPIGELRGKHIIMLLPRRDKVIDPNEVAEEISLHRPYNDVTLIRTNGGHYRTIISETVLHPRRVLNYIRKLEQQ